MRVAILLVLLSACSSPGATMDAATDAAALTTDATPDAWVNPNACDEPGAFLGCVPGGAQYCDSAFLVVTTYVCECTICDDTIGCPPVCIVSCQGDAVHDCDGTLTNCPYGCRQPDFCGYSYCQDCFAGTTACQGSAFVECGWDGRIVSSTECANGCVDPSGCAP